MARTVTLLSLRTQARERADMEDSDFISDSELNGYINSSIAALYELVVQATGEDYYVVSTEFNTVVGQETYDLPSDFFKAWGMDAKLDNSDWCTLRKFNFRERNRYHDDSFSRRGVTGIRYRIIGSSIYLTPVPDSAVPVRLWYVPAPTKLESDSDTFDGIAGWEEYVVVDAAIKMLNKEESDVTVLLRERDLLQRRIESSAVGRSQDPETIVDTRSVYWEDDCE